MTNTTMNKYKLADMLLSVDNKMLDDALKIAQYHCPALYADRIVQLESALRQIVDSVTFDDGKPQIKLSYLSPEITSARQLIEGK